MKSVRILMIEDNDADYHLTRRLLDEPVTLRGNRLLSFDLLRVPCIAEGMNLLADKAFDVVLLDISLPDSDDLLGLHQIQGLAPHTPVVIYSGLAEESMAIDALQNGAQDFIYKGSSGDLLRRSIYYAIERQRILLELEREKRLAESATAAKSQFLANISHEIRTPLTAILGFSEAALVGNSSSEEQRSALGKIQKNGLHLLQLVNDVLDVSKIDAGKIEIEYLATNVALLASEVIATFLKPTVKKNVVLELDCDYPFPSLLMTDVTRIRQILFNLLSNAVKFTSEGEIRVHLSYDSGAEQLRIQVRDTGIGIRPEDQGRLFQAFSQGDVSTTRQFGGTGLGLYLCARLLRAMNGRITLESTIGQGSIFNTYIPAAVAEGSTPLSAAPTLEHMPQFDFEVPRFRGRVLLAEDSQDTAELMTYLLQQSGLDVTSVSTGLQAVSLAAAEDFNLLILDMHMPEMDGLTAATRIREKDRSTPMLAATASSSKEVMSQCQLVGFTDFIAKPFQWKEFYRVIAKYLVTRESDENKDDRALVSEVFLERPDFLPLIYQFVSRLPKRLAHLEQAFENSNFDHLKNLAHSLKGAAAYGYPKLGELASALEIAASENNAKAANASIQQLRTLIPRIESGLNQMAHR